MSGNSSGNVAVGTVIDIDETGNLEVGNPHFHLVWKMPPERATINASR